MPTKRLAAVHLVRKKNGLETVCRFLRSYQKYDPGIEHDLIFILKGFRDDAEQAAYRDLLRAVRHKIVEVPDWGYDITSYWLAAKRLDYEYFCFLNSFSAILAHGWLEKLYRGVTQKGAGLAGATGSYQSFQPLSLRSYLKTSRKIKHRGPVKDVLMALPFSHHLNYVRRKLIFWPGFRKFPNYHVRTNAFILSRQLMCSAVHVPIISKMDTYRFESGRHGLTAQAIRMGLEPVVVGANGEYYRKEDWHASDTFWQAHQENLLVADNQTRRYAGGTRTVREALSYVAWGDHARPG